MGPLTLHRARRTVSVCGGAFVLAEAGLLSGRRVTTHWDFSQKLQEDYPALNVDPEPLFIRDGNVVTAAGVASGLDSALWLVEEDLGTDIALRVARALVLFIRRSGGQSQFSTALAFQESSKLPIRELPIRDSGAPSPRPRCGDPGRQGRHEPAQFLWNVREGVPGAAGAVDHRSPTSGNGSPTAGGKR